MNKDLLQAAGAITGRPHHQPVARRVALQAERRGHLVCQRLHRVGKVARHRRQAARAGGDTCTLSKSPYVVAVRALCEFTAKAGDLDLRFTPAPSAQEGQLGHAVVASRRKGEHYQRELSLAGEYKGLSVRGRADGYDAAQNNRVEEVKTHRGDLARLPDNHRALHWAQAKVYGWLLCQQRGLGEIQIALVYFDIGTQQETVLCETHQRTGAAASLRAAMRAFPAMGRAGAGATAQGATRC